MKCYIFRIESVDLGPKVWGREAKDLFENKVVYRGGRNLEIIILYGLIAFALLLLPKYLRFRGSNYQAASGNNFINTVFDRGNFGEFLTFSYLEKLGENHKLMTNLYIPKDDGMTTEIDLIMISHTGIYVFESKNYSGWIFGDENNKNWTQTLKNKQKNKFFNPVWQNKGHIDALKSVLGLEGKFFKSYIIFSERSVLKKISLTSLDVKVIKRNALLKTIKIDLGNSLRQLTDQQINDIYFTLSKYTLADFQTRKDHIEAIKLRRY